MADALPGWVAEVQEYDQIRAAKTLIAALYVAIFVYPLDDHDNTACSIWIRESPMSLLTRFQRALIWTSLVIGQFAHLMWSNTVLNEPGFVLALALILWVCWDRQLSDNLSWYKAYVDRVEIPGIASTHELVSAFAFLALALLPLSLEREFSLDLLSSTQKAIGLCSLYVVFAIAWILNGPHPGADALGQGAAIRLRNFWFLNVFEATIITLGVASV